MFHHWLVPGDSACVLQYGQLFYHLYAEPSISESLEDFPVYLPNSLNSCLSPYLDEAHSYPNEQAWIHLQRYNLYCKHMYKCYINYVINELSSDIFARRRRQLSLRLFSITVVMSITFVFTTVMFTLNVPYTLNTS